MSWAASRETTRVEDEAYCLMGIFGINMPLLYGEGPRAFRRLQEAIMREDEDYTLFAWTPARLAHTGGPTFGGLLAHSPRDFAKLRADRDGTAFVPCDYDKLSKSPLPLFRYSDIGSVPLSLTNRGLHLSLPVGGVVYGTSSIIACLATFVLGDFDYLLCVRLHLRGERNRLFRNHAEPMWFVSATKKAEFGLRTIYVEQPSTNSDKPMSACSGDPCADSVFVEVKVSKDAQLEYALVPSSLSIRMQNFIDARSLYSSPPGEETGPLDETTSQRVDLLHEFCHVTENGLCQSPLDKSDLCFLAENEDNHECLDCMVKGHPKTKFRITLAPRERIPGFYIHLYDLQPWNGTDQNGTPLRLKDNLFALPGSSEQAVEKMDRAILHATVATDETGSPHQELHEISISLRRVSSTTGAIEMRRFVLAIGHRILGYLGNKAFTLAVHDNHETAQKAEKSHVPERRVTRGTAP